MPNPDDESTGESQLLFAAMDIIYHVAKDLGEKHKSYKPLMEMTENLDFTISEIEKEAD